jgi:hypothetical protein
MHPKKLLHHYAVGVSSDVGAIQSPVESHGFSECPIIFLLGERFIRWTRDYFRRKYGIAVLEAAGLFEDDQLETFELRYLEPHFIETLRR